MAIALFPSGIQSRKQPGAGRDCDAHIAHDGIQCPSRSAFLLFRQRMQYRAQLTADLPENSFPPPFGTKTTWYLQSHLSGLGFDKRLTFDPPTSWSSSH